MTASATTANQDTKGYYKITLGSGVPKDAGWTLTQDGLHVDPDFEDKWVYADSWQDAVRKTVTGSATVSGTPVPHFFGWNGAFAVGTEAEIYEEFNEDGNPKKKVDWSSTSTTKRIVLEDSYGSIDIDFDDFGWNLSVVQASNPAAVELGILYGASQLWNATSPAWSWSNQCYEQSVALMSHLREQETHYWRVTTDGGWNGLPFIGYHHVVMLMPISVTSPLDPDHRVPQVFDPFKPQNSESIDVKWTTGHEFRLAYPFDCGCCKSHSYPIIE